MIKSPPIAIVGRALLVPGAHSPEELWEKLIRKESLISSVPKDRWGIRLKDVLCEPNAPSDDRTWSDRGGYVRGFDEIFDPEGFAISAEEILSLDPLFQWTFHTAREALRDAGYQNKDASRFGAVFGNLSFPSAGMAGFTQATTIKSLGGYGEEALSAAGIETPAAANRFNSGLPALMLEKALGLGKKAFALDAACASSLYAIKLACDQLQDGTTDLMLAGAVNCADDLCIHLGFSALKALSKTGQSRPFHKDADGLVPAEGCGFVVLRRLEDAIADGDTIYGIIRGVGLSNDGRGRGMLVPSREGQSRAISKAFDCAGLTPADVSLLECHATGTEVGDTTEINSSADIYGKRDRAGRSGRAGRAGRSGRAKLPIGSLKSNTGHLITAAGVAGLIKVLEAMKHETLPPTLHCDSPLDEIEDSPFRLLKESEPWDRDATSDGILRAGISAFGFGGNNAHLIVEEAASAEAILASYISESSQKEPDENTQIVIVGIGINAASAMGRDAFGRALTDESSCLDEHGEGRMDDISLKLKGLKFPPNDLKKTLSQQLALLNVAEEALENVALPKNSTGVYIGMGTDPEAARFGVRWRLISAGQKWGCTPEWIANARDSVSPVLDAAGVMGTMPNIVANRLNSQFDLGGASFTVSAEEHSGLVALDVATRALRAGEIDAALVGAVDFSCNQTHQAAAKICLGADRQIPGDAAVVLILKRKVDAEESKDTIYAILPTSTVETDADLRLGLGSDLLNLNALFGHAHAASALVHVAAAAHFLHHRTLLGGRPFLASNYGSGSGLAEGVGPRTVSVTVEAMGAMTPRQIMLAEANEQLAPSTLLVVPQLHIFRGKTTQALLGKLDKRQTSGLEDPTNEACLVVVASNDEELEERLNKARLHIEQGHPPGRGVHFRLKPIVGEMAFVFTAAGAAYRGMGEELLRQIPELITPISQCFPIGEVSGWVYDEQTDSSSVPTLGPRPTLGPGPSDYLWGTSMLTQAHVRLTRHILNLKPSAAIGYSSGESNSLYAFDVWSDMDAMRREIDESGMMEHELGINFAAIARAWETDSVEWSVWNVLAPLSEVQALVDNLSRVHIAIINTATDIIIGGDRESCDKLVEKIGRKRCLRVGYNLACHVPEVGQSFHKPWIDIHTRKVTPAKGIRYYSNGIGGAYEVGEDACAQTITAQAETTLDFPKTIQSAFDDGVRVFIEHGPAGACTKFISEILKGHDDVLCIQLDRRDKNIEQIFEVIAALSAAGIDVDHATLSERLKLKPNQNPDNASEPSLQFPSHPEPIDLPPRVNLGSQARNVLEGKVTQMTKHKVYNLPKFQSPILSESAFSEVVYQARLGLSASRAMTAKELIEKQVAAMTAMHQTFIEQQSAIHTQFLSMRVGHQSAVVATGLNSAAGGGEQVRQVVQQRESVSKITNFTNLQATTPSPIQTSPPVEQIPIEQIDSATGIIFKPVGPEWDKKQLKIHSSGKISQLFGPIFEPQDGYDLQCRMPEPPLLLADRVTGIEAKPGVLGRGKIWTQTDVKEGDWYLNDGYMPAGFMIESGQADLMLISYMGIDLLNKGERVYRLLGCTLTYHADLPSVGETLEYEIRVNGHAKHGDVRLFFFDYDCIVDGHRRLTVRDGQAGFFSYKELADALGILWTAEAAKKDLKPDAILDPPLVSCTKSSFSREEVSAFSEGRLFDCFGSGYEWGQTHTRSPHIQTAENLFIDEVTQYDPKGGPWGRGFMRCETAINSDDWYFKGHFKNDPCMPGNFMVEACIQALSFYIAAAGYTLKKDGWRFQPLPEQSFELKCRGEINPQTKHVAYEIHVEEFRAGPHPTVICDVVGFVDGEAAFHAHQIGVELVPDWPLTTMQNIINDPSKKAPSGTFIAQDKNGFPFDWKAMISCAWGRPSEAFGSMYGVFDGIRQSPRLPGEPYHFVSRIVKIDGELDVCKAGMEIISEYDIPESAWYFDENGAEVMPFAVLLEAALQPCGWVASAIGSVTKLDDDLMFRNLDGTGTVLQELTRTSGILSTHVKVTNVSNAGGMVIESFEVQCFIGDIKVYEMDTVFGFFPSEAFDNQAGLPIKEVHRIRRDAKGISIDLKSAPEKFCSGSLRLADPMLLMIDRAVHIPNAGEAQLGILRGEKDVDVSEWFFKAHFFQDPVQPGSLGIEALIQLLQFYMLETGMGLELGDEAYFEPLKLDAPMTWKYRGQVTPKNKLITSTMEITEIGTDEIGPFVIGKGSLWVDGLRIYEASNLGMRIVAAKKKTTVNDTVIFSPNDDDALSTIVQSFWNPFLGTPEGWLGEDIVLGLINQYVNRVVVNRKTLERLQGKPAIYLANHQVQIESLIVTNLIPALTGLPMTTLANAKHRTRWIGQLIEGLQSYPGFQTFEQIVYFEQDKPESMFEIIEQMRTDMANGVRSFFVHTDGTRAQSCREKTRRCSSVFLDLALELNIPIVPFSFTGGLPVEAISGKAEVPFEHGRQDYWIGEPIEPETLRALSLRERVDTVVSAINALGVTPQKDRPLPSDKQFARSVEQSRKETGAHEIFVSIRKVLENAKKKNPETTHLLELMNSNPQTTNESLLSPSVLQWLDQMRTLLMRSISPTPTLELQNASNLTINLSDYPYLVDHAIDGRPVIPVVLIIEWFTRILKETGEHCGMVLHQILDLQVLKGLTIEENELKVSIKIRTLDESKTEQKVTLELSQMGARRINYRCKAILSSVQKEVSGADVRFTVPQKKKNLYGGVLFHGPLFQVIKSIAFTDTGCEAILIGVLAKVWKTKSPWRSDPALLDGALQMALLWTEKLLGGKSLPTKIDEIQIFHPPTLGDFCATLTGQSATKNRVICDVIIQDDKGTVVAKLTGIETHRLG